jgi:YD repeat-containing protein
MLSMPGKTVSHRMGTRKRFARAAKCTFAGRYTEQMQRISRFCVLATFLSSAALAGAQANAGTPSWGAQDSGQYDTINIQSLSVGLNIPIMSKSGAFPFSASLLGGGSYIYYNSAFGTLLPGIYINPLQGAINGVLSPALSAFTWPGTRTSVTCPSGDGSGAAVEYTNWYVQLPDGTTHYLPAADAVYGGINCSSSLTDQVTDGTGWSLILNGGAFYNGHPTPAVTTVSSGGMVLPCCVSSSISDSQSTPNQITYTSSSGIGTFTDTLGMSVLSTNPSGPGEYQWTDTNGGNQMVTQVNTSETLKSSFGCPGKSDYDISGVALPTAIDFSDSTTLGLAWEENEVTSTDYTGRLAKITMRDGSSTVQFNYNPGGATTAPYNLNCTYLVPNSMTRTTSDGTVTYTTSFTTSSPYIETVTKVDIGGNKTVYSFTGFTATGTAAAPTAQVLTEVQAYANTGTVTRPTYSSTPMQLVIYCYNNSSPTVSSCPTSTVNEPVTEMDTFTKLSGMSTYARQQTQYDGGPSGALPHYGNVTYSAQYDFGGTSPIQATTIVYGSSNGSGTCSAIGNNVNNKPCTVVTTLNGNTVASSQFAYDSHGNLLKTYVSPNGGTSFLSNPTVNSYNANGTPATLYDLAGNPTNFTYNSSYYTDCSSCINFPFATKVVRGGLTTYSYYNGYGGVKTEDIDANGNATFYCYNNTTTTSCSGGTADPWNRVMAVIDPLNNQVFKTYSVTSLTSSFTFNSGSSIHGSTTTLDGYGRVVNVQRPQSPTGSNYDTTSIYRTFPSGSHVNEQIQSTNPCSVASATLCGTSYGPTNTYDMLGRLINSVQSGSNATGTITYNENDVLTALTPAPSGENKKQVQNQYDGLGRLTSSCAVSSNVSGNVSCGQNVATSPTNGILTTTTYSSAAGSQTVTASRGPSNQQQRSMTRDGLGRVTQKKTPEGGTWTYTYDQNTSCPSPWRGANGQLASVADPNGNLLCYEYDGLNRVIGVNADGTTCRWFYYDNSSGYTGTVPSGITLANQYGRLVEATTDTCIAVSSHTSATIITDEWFTYDKDGNKVDLWELTPHSTQYYHSHVASFYGNGVPTSVALASPSLYTMEYGLDGEGRPNTLTDSTANQDIVTGTSFFPATTTPTVSLTRSDNDAYTIDLNTNRINKFVFTVGSNNLTGNLNWNANGTLGSLAITDGFNSGGSETCYSNSSGSLGYGYDDLARLVEFDCGSGKWGQEFAYDQYDNLTKTVLSGRTGTTWNPGYSQTTNQYSSPSNCCDSNGNVKTDGNDVYGWNEFSKLAWTAPTGTPSCGTSGRCTIYDAFGRMVESSVNSTWKTYWYTQGGTMVMAGTTMSIGNWPVGSGIAETVGTTCCEYLHNDWLGNSRIVSSVSANTVTADQAYTPYGEIYNIFGANNGYYQVFAGTIADLAPSTTTPIMWDTPNRELSYAGRWLSPDPAGVGWNQYAYPTNPNSEIDPSGLTAYLGLGGGQGVIVPDHPCPASGTIVQEHCLSGTGPGSVSGTCNVDGLDEDCGMASSDATVQCPNNGCIAGIDGVLAYFVAYITGSTYVPNAGPGSVFDTNNQAMTAGALYAENLSLLNNGNEWAGMTYSANDKFSYTDAVEGTYDGSQPIDAMASIPDGDNPVGAYHSHGVYDPDYANDRFSGQPGDREAGDVGWSSRMGYPLSVATPGGNVIIYNPGSGCQTFVLGGSFGTGTTLPICQ